MNWFDGLKKTAKPRSLRWQLLVAVNATLGVAIAALLVMRYQREMNDAIVDKRAGLVDEAIVIHQAVTHATLEHSLDDVQPYLDGICSRMRDSRSPGHQIVVRVADATYSAGTHQGELLDIGTATDRGSDSERRDTLVIGSDVRDGVAVYVAEYVANIRRSIRAEVLSELGILMVLGVVATIIVNFVLLRVVDGPLANLLKTVRRISRGELGAQSETTGSLEMRELAHALNEMSVALDEVDEQQRRQMEKAREIQEHLLPMDAQVPGLRTALLYRPAEGVSGDYCDFLPLPDGSWLICIADVMGHGVPAAMGAAMLKMLLLFAAERGRTSPALILDEINQRFARTALPGDFASMFLGHWSPESKTLAYAGAGHPPPIRICRDGRLESLPSTGLLLGIEGRAAWQERTVELSPSDRLLLFTDGAIETRGVDGELFGNERLVAWFSRCEGVPFEDVLNRLDQTLSEYRGDSPVGDDLTFVLLECSIEDERRAQIRPPKTGRHAPLALQTER